MKKALVSYAKNIKCDDRYTPYEAISPLLNYLPKKRLTIWECCDFGNSKISEILRKNKYNVISTDIKTNFNFLVDKPNFDFDIIVTNPPYSIKNEWLEKCYEYNKPFALLLPITALESKARNELFKQYGISIVVLDKRINFTNKENIWFNTSWFLWNIVPNNKIYYESV